MSKKCDKCTKEYSGFGTTCSDCRKSKATGGYTGGSGAGGADANNCTACGKVAYAMEKLVVEGQTFHPTCFKCTHCGNKLGLNAFSKSNDGKYYCKTHYMQLFKTRGRYSIGNLDEVTKGEEEERADRTTQADMAATAEQERRVAEQAALEEAAKAEQEKAKEDADKAADEEQARRVAEIEEKDKAAAAERKTSQDAADEAMVKEQSERITEAEASPERKRSSFTPDLAELAAKVAETAGAEAEPEA